MLSSDLSSQQYTVRYNGGGVAGGWVENQVTETGDLHGIKEKKGNQEILGYWCFWKLFGGYVFKTSV